MKRNCIAGILTVGMMLVLLAVFAEAQGQKEEGSSARLAELLALTPADIAAMSQDERAAARQEVDALLVEKDTEAQALQVEMSDARRAVLAENPRVQELKKQIQQLRSEMNAVVERDEAVCAGRMQRKAVLDVMMDLMKVKRELVGAE